MQNTKNLLIRSRMLQGATLLFVVLTFWWLAIQPFNREAFVYLKHLWSAFYVTMPLLGGVYGFVISKTFGGRKNLIGKVLFAFSVGLFLQVFGQFIYTVNYETPQCHFSTATLK